jgi:hypothetical protein
VIAHVLLLLLTATNAQGAVTPVTHTFIPANPVTSDFIQLRTDVLGCFSIFGAVTVLPQEPAIEVRFQGTDLPCDSSIPANVQSPRFADIGALPPGSYATRIYSCGFGPMGTVCDVIQSGTLLVSVGPVRRRVIPSASFPALMFLAMALGVAGVRKRLR